MSFENLLESNYYCMQYMFFFYASMYRELFASRKETQFSQLSVCWSVNPTTGAYYCRSYWNWMGNLPALVQIYYCDRDKTHKPKSRKNQIWICRSSGSRLCALSSRVATMVSKETRWKLPFSWCYITYASHALTLITKYCFSYGTVKKKEEKRTRLGSFRTFWMYVCIYIYIW